MAKTYATYNKSTGRYDNPRITTGNSGGSSTARTNPNTSSKQQQSQTGYYSTKQRGFVTNSGKFYPTNNPNFTPSGFTRVATPTVEKYTPAALNELISRAGQKGKVTPQELEKNPNAIEQLEKKAMEGYDKNKVQALINQAGQKGKVTPQEIQNNKNALMQLQKKVRGDTQVYAQTHNKVAADIQASRERVYTKGFKEEINKTGTVNLVRQGTNIRTEPTKKFPKGRLLRTEKSPVGYETTETITQQVETEKKIPLYEISRDIQLEPQQRTPSPQESSTPEWVNKMKEDKTSTYKSAEGEYINPKVPFKMGLFPAAEFVAAHSKGKEVLENINIPYYANKLYEQSERESFEPKTTGKIVSSITKGLGAVSLGVIEVPISAAQYPKEFVVSSLMFPYTALTNPKEVIKPINENPARFVGNIIGAQLVFSAIGKTVKTIKGQQMVPQVLKEFLREEKPTYLKGEIKFTEKEGIIKQYANKVLIQDKSAQRMGIGKITSGEVKNGVDMTKRPITPNVETIIGKIEERRTALSGQREPYLVVIEGETPSGSKITIGTDLKGNVEVTNINTKYMGRDYFITAITEAGETTTKVFRKKIFSSGFKEIYSGKQLTQPIIKMTEYITKAETVETSIKQPELTVQGQSIIQQSKSVRTGYGDFKGYMKGYPKAEATVLTNELIKVESLSWWKKLIASEKPTSLFEANKKVQMNPSIELIKKDVTYDLVREGVLSNEFKTTVIGNPQETVIIETPNRIYSEQIANSKGKFKIQLNPDKNTPIEQSKTPQIAQETKIDVKAIREAELKKAALIDKNFPKTQKKIYNILDKYFKKNPPKETQKITSLQQETILEPKPKQETEIINYQVETPETPKNLQFTLAGISDTTSEIKGAYNSLYLPLNANPLKNSALYQQKVIITEKPTQFTTIPKQSQFNEIKSKSSVFLENRTQTKINTKTETNYKPIIDIKTDIISRAQTNTKTNTLTNSIVNTKAETKAETKTETKAETKTETKAETRAMTQTKTQTATKSFTNTMTMPIPEPPPEINTKIGIGGKKKKKTDLFITEIRKKGKFKGIAIKESKEAAINLGIQTVRNTAAASFRIKEKSTGKPITSFGNIGKGFYSSKKQTGVIIQKRGTRITTQGEKKEITFKGIAANRTKNKKGIWR